jgi:hypothetical protein
LWAGEAKKERFTNIAFGRCWYACGFMAANWVLSCHDSWAECCCHRRP